MALAKDRFITLDIFRGMTICFMIIVNAPGSGAVQWAPLDHAAWFGFTPTDLVFPSFLFAVGNALSFSKNKFESNSAFLRKIGKRTLIIFLLGYLMYWFPFFHREAGGWGFNPLGSTRIMGVLQRIALCYFFGSLIVHYCSKRIAVIISVLLLLGYWVFLLLLGEPGKELTMLGNAGTRLDILIMGNAHLYHDKGGPIAFDPEGLLSTLPAIVNVIAGYLAGAYIQRKGRNYESVAKLLIAGVCLIGIALFWAQFFPLAKKLWTSTFTLLTIGIDLVIIGVLIYAIEIKNIKRSTNFFLVFGRNSLAIYLLSELLLTIISTVWVKPNLSFYDWINQVFYQPLFPGAFGTLVFAICYMMFCWLVGYMMDKRKVYIKI
ncbi:Predicted acyltransferase [Mucilaginibacter lappiensis]|uniref:Acyltransferase n=1 Tax=Mucilaginibacter lappiensis TaxID=354630 RepID=A0ABR6PDW4_9SPHI|nr:heparan-alpha-glucosaminide N-acetyltransferase domain-containing protein [Mucilaginibacter lappiensis]MBB6107917.1 putative acyltransferase [Mucilaginibacter lappiensis]SIP92639.1 Predicted acyltransferase [Mucilaginibacter lappiensis]